MKALSVFRFRPLLRLALALQELMSMGASACLPKHALFAFMFVASPRDHGSVSPMALVRENMQTLNFTPSNHMRTLPSTLKPFTPNLARKAQTLNTNLLYSPRKKSVEVAIFEKYYSCTAYSARFLGSIKCGGISFS